MQVFDKQPQKLVCSRAIYEEIRTRFASLRAVHLTAEFSIVDFPPEYPNLLEDMRHSGLGVSTRVLDGYYFAYRDIGESQRIAVAFFGYIASEYEETIDIKRNLQNIEFLVSCIDLELGGIENRNILDFGCGTGLSARNERLRSAKLIGFDLSPEMRYLAIANGVPSAWSYEDLVSAPEGLVDGVFASYVLHLLPTTQTLSRLWSALRDGGIFIGNCHKGEGKKFAEVFFDSVHGEYVSPRITAPECHGPYVCFRKV